MLYVPPAFKVEDRGALHAHIEATGLAMLVTLGEDRPLVSHLPLMLDSSSGANGALIGHLARGNPQWTMSRPGAWATAVFQGPDAYVSPSWYASKAEHGRVVPTWNYAVVHARGPCRFIDDASELRGIVDRLTGRHEAGRAKPWSTADAPADYIDRQLKGIVGVVIEIAEMEGIHKLSQNRSAADRQGVIEGMGASAREADRETARLMAGRYLP
jgi:transcriptional regulator